jgi:hypothetical protein
MPNAILDALSLLDGTGRLILAASVASLLAALGAHIARPLAHSARKHVRDRCPQVV